MAESDILKETVDVKVGDETYEFRIPSYLDELKIGIREKNIRRELEGQLGGDMISSAEGLDPTTNFMIRTAATFECLLVKSSAVWPWSSNGSGAPIVDFKKWPKDKVGDAISVGVAYSAEIARFREGGVPDGNAPSAEVMESKSDS